MDKDGFSNPFSLVEILTEILNNSIDDRNIYGILSDCLSIFISQQIK